MLFKLFAKMACTLLLDDDYVAVADQKSLELMALSVVLVRQMLLSLLTNQQYR